jgi:hypothetical protein
MGSTGRSVRKVALRESFMNFQVSSSSSLSLSRFFEDRLSGSAAVTVAVAAWHQLVPVLALDVAITMDETSRKFIQPHDLKLKDAERQHLKASRPRLICQCLGCRIVPNCRPSLGECHESTAHDGHKLSHNGVTTDGAVTAVQPVRLSVPRWQ